MLALPLKHSHPIQTSGDNIVGIWRPSFVKVDQQLYAFGGGGGNVTDDLHCLDLITMRWKSIQNVIGTPPSSRYGHTMTRWKNTMIVFGGCNENQDYCGDVYIFDIKTSAWYQPTIKNSITARYLHSAIVYKDKLIIYGGFARSSECTYVLDDICILDLNEMIWTKYNHMPPRYNHSATLIGHKMYIFAGKDEQGSTVSDLFMVNLSKLPFTPHLVLSSNSNQGMVLLKSQHFCDTICGKLFVFGRFVNGQHDSESIHSLWSLDLDALEWEKQDCDRHFEVGNWNYFGIFNKEEESEVNSHHLLFLGNMDPYRAYGYDHFRQVERKRTNAFIIHSESLGFYDIPDSKLSVEFMQLLNTPELSDFSIFAANGEKIHVHQVILLTRWPHFKNIHKSGMLEAIEQKMTIPEPVEVVMAFLKFLYSDRLDESETCEIICELLVLANLYCLQKLKKLCCERLYRCYLTIENCGLIFEKAILAEEIGLKMLVLNFMFQNYGFILKSNMLMDLPASIRKEFLDAVPNEAVLEIGKTRFMTPSLQCIVTYNQDGTGYHQNNIDPQQRSTQIATIINNNEFIPLNTTIALPSTNSDMTVN
ncbi:uncharacterized protein BX663DRAFT_477289 [Cokeromyces recurvatus]|uniref:uncharacterized protein n=1 Tax=Cokeromyces recurvatus TaxID=90255 RepID=UPI00221F9A94|nr:uncharacterized protein BX663DRAFT_477289 [Cokeromyces recurvatus]KAI7900069.1 hypothetical protein BX663DRAFT_477289 [Cokeromyces recurvatus]